MGPQKVSGTYELPYEIKVDWRIYLIFTAVFAPIAGFFTYVAIQNFAAWPFLVICIVSLAGFLIWAESNSISLKEDRLVYSNLFSGSKEMLYSGITKAGIQMAVRKGKTKKEILSGFNLYDQGLYFGIPWYINTKTFSPMDMAVFANILVAKNPAIKIDRPLEEFKERQFKIINEEGIRLRWQNILWGIFILMIFALYRIITHHTL